MDNEKRYSYRLLAGLVISLVMGGAAQAGDVLMVNIHGTTYDGDGASIHQTLVNAGAAADYVNLSSDGQVAAALQAKQYDQVWVFDLSTGADSYPTDYAAIANWYDGRQTNEIIADGRMISSY